MSTFAESRIIVEGYRVMALRWADAPEHDTSQWHRLTATTAEIGRIIFDAGEAHVAALWVWPESPCRCIPQDCRFARYCSPAIRRKYNVLVVVIRSWCQSCAADLLMHTVKLYEKHWPVR